MRKRALGSSGKRNARPSQTRLRRRIGDDYFLAQFELNEQKCIEGIQFLASEQPGITQYYIGKVFFFADLKHLLDWGRPISGDRYVAMEHGPVPSYIYDLIKSKSGEPDEIEDELSRRIKKVTDGNKIRLYQLQNAPTVSHLSRSDQEYLLDSLEEYGKMSFVRIKLKSHDDKAWADAWSRPGLNNEMDARLWLSEEQIKSVCENSEVIKRKKSA